MNKRQYILIGALFFFAAQFIDGQSDGAKMTNNIKSEIATFGSGCFWCSEAIFENLEGVISVRPGYSGGNKANPTYEEVCTGETGHAEVVQIEFHPEVISFEELLEVFWSTHDPTTLNRQGADIGTQYRSTIFYHDKKQKELAEEYKEKLDKSGAFSNPIVTEIREFREFYPAEEYHRNYFEEHPDKAYCNFVIKPKLDKFKKVFKNKLKSK